MVCLLHMQARGVRPKECHVQVQVAVRVNHFMANVIAHNVPGRAGLQAAESFKDSAKHINKIGVEMSALNSKLQGGDVR